MTLSSLLWLALGFVLLGVGAEGLVRGSSAIARRAGVSPLVIGLTLVAFGTSAPELAVSVFASAAGKHDIAVANVVGSNIFNVLLPRFSAVMLEFVLPLTVFGIAVVVVQRLTQARSRPSPAGGRAPQA